MVFVFTVSYPRHEGFRFDQDHYMKVHMPLAKNTWTPSCTGYEVTFFESGPHVAIAQCYFDSQEGFAKATAAPESATVAADMPNYTDITPVLGMGTLGGRDGK